MGSVVAAQGVDERAVADKPVLVYMAAEVHEFVDHVGHGRRADKKPTYICGHHKPEQDGTGDRDQDKDHQCIRRKDRYSPVGLVSKTHFLICKKPVVVQRMAIVYGAEPLPLTWSVHDIAMQAPLENIAACADHRDRKPLPPLDIL